MSECELCGKSDNYCNECGTCFDCLDEEHSMQIQSLQQQIKDLKDKIKLCADILTEGYHPEKMEYDLQSVNWVHGHLDTNLVLIDKKLVESHMKIKNLNKLRKE